MIDRTEVTSDVPIRFSTAGIGGPSAGLMFSLAIYTQIADPGLRNGRIVAGTGTIDRDGNVGDIGGIDKKVVASAREGAAIFFAPDNPVSEEEQKAHPDAKNNYQTALEAAKTIKTDMKIVPVKTLQDAIDYLKNNTLILSEVSKLAHKQRRWYNSQMVQLLFTLSSHILFYFILSFLPF